MGNIVDGSEKLESRAVLENIISDRGTEYSYPIYSLANHRKKGLLIDTYMQSGREGLKKVAQQLLPKFLNNSCKMNNDQVTVPLEGQVERCWKLEERGILGESLLHVLIFSNSPVHTEIAQCLLELYPSMVLDVIEGEEYFGASALHLSIAYGNYELTRLLLECGADVNQRATGRFFKPDDQKLPKPKKETNFQGLCYLGEYPLFWAACSEDESSYNLLLKYGADPNVKDSFGNMVLQVIVVADKQSMYGYALKHPTFPAKDDSLNKYGLTPLTLACKLGRNAIFREMLELRSMFKIDCAHGVLHFHLTSVQLKNYACRVKLLEAKSRKYCENFGTKKYPLKEIWRYSTVNCSCYPLNALDSLLPSGRTNWNSALLIILGGNTEEHLDMLHGGVIQRLLEEKWKTFARRKFLQRLSLVLVHLTVLSIAVFLRRSSEMPLLSFTDCRCCAEVGTCIGCLGFVVLQPAEEILAQGVLAFFINLISNPPKGVFLVSSTLILLCIPCRLIGNRYCEDMLLSMALPGSWFFLIFFAGAVRLTGPFVTMIYSILTGDMFRFSIIYFIFLLAFTQAFYFLFKNQPSEAKTKRFQTYQKTWISIFQMTLGNFEYDEFRRTLYHYLTQITFALFLVFMPILLLNMLIAMMGNTYCQVIEQSEKEWMKQWAKIVVALERAVNQKEAREYIESYSIPFTPPLERECDPQRAVMVIRRKTKSKAKQRKGALKNWKRVGRKVIFQLKKHGGVATVDKEGISGEHEALPSTNTVLMPEAFDEAINQLVSSRDLLPPTPAVDQTPELPASSHNEDVSVQQQHNSSQAMVASKLIQTPTKDMAAVPDSVNAQRNYKNEPRKEVKDNGYMENKQRMKQPIGKERRSSNILFSYPSEDSVNENRKIPKQKKLSKRRAFSHSKVGPTEEISNMANSESEEYSWRIGLKVEGSRRVRTRRRRTTDEPKCDVRHARKRKKTKLTAKDDNTEQSMPLFHSVKQTAFNQRSTNNVVAMASLVAWDESEQ